MDVSTDSQVDFYVSVDDHDSGDEQTMENITEHEEANVSENGPDGGHTASPPPAVVHLIAGSFGAGGTGPPATAIAAANTAAGTDGIVESTGGGHPSEAASTGTNATSSAATPTAGMTRPTGVSSDWAAMTTATPYTMFGIAPGDGDFMPPRFGGDPATDAEQWIQDFLDYTTIRRVPDATASVLLRTRLTGTARKWVDSVPPNLDLHETVRRFRARFGINEAARNRMLTDFWHRRQLPTEPTSQYIEDMAHMARRMELNNESLLRVTIINGLLPEIRRDVTLQQPKSLDELTAAAAIGEANVRANAARAGYDDEAVAGQLTELRTMMTQFREMMTAQQRQVVGVQSVEPTTYRPDPPAHTTTTAAVRPSPDAAATTAALPATTTNPPVTVNLVMPEAVAAQYGGGSGGRGRGGRGRGWRGPWRGPPQTPRSTTQQPLNTATPTVQGNASGPAPAIGQPANISDNPCLQCGRRHAEGDCRAMYALCYGCGLPGHYMRRCVNRPDPNIQH